MFNIVFAANEPTFQRFMEHFKIEGSNYILATSGRMLKPYTHNNARFILTDGYAVNPAFLTEYYVQAVGEAKEAGVIKNFLERKMMNDT